MLRVFTLIIVFARVGIIPKVFLLSILTSLHGMLSFTLRNSRFHLRSITHFDEKTMTFIVGLLEGWEHIVLKSFQMLFIGLLLRYVRGGRIGGIFQENSLRLDDDSVNSALHLRLNRLLILFIFLVRSWLVLRFYFIFALLVDHLQIVG